jgi:hypothetical protein
MMRNRWGEPLLVCTQKIVKESVCHGWRIKGFSKNSVGNNRHPQGSILNLVCVLFCIGDWATFSTSQQTTLLHRMDHFGQNALCLLQMARERMPKENIIKHHTHTSAVLCCWNAGILKSEGHEKSKCSPQVFPFPPSSSWSHPVANYLETDTRRIKAKWKWVHLKHTLSTHPTPTTLWIPTPHIHSKVIRCKERASLPNP